MKILQLWRYPVKSVQGERVESIEVGTAGLQGDRSWALRDRTTGLTLTARRQPELLFATCRLVDERAVLCLPDGTESDDDGVLSAWLGRDVELLAADDAPASYEIATDFEDEAGSDWVSWNGPAKAFHDSAKARVSIIGAATLGEWPVRRFRPNVLVSGGDEDSFVGRTLRAASGVALEVVKQIDRCVMITRPQPPASSGAGSEPAIERDLDVLRTVNRDRGTFVGVGSLVRSGGVLSVGDELTPADA